MTNKPRKHDRFTQAYALRKAIYKYIKTRPGGCLTADIFAAMPNVNKETIRKSVYAMRDHGTLRIEISTARVGTVYIGNRPVKTENESVKNLKTAGRTAINNKKNQHGNAIDTVKNPTSVRGAVTTHLGSRRVQPLSNQGGQGAVRPRVYVGTSAGMV